ncbi:MAG: VanZ family protein [Oscillospiraceae bacterium]|nr:VanZ family protein [Oscillospiraceae bacterium]
MKKRILSILILLNLALIWGNSMLTGISSEAVSGGILALLGRFLPVLLTEAGHTLLRKAAHFSEFALLGLLYCGRHRLVKGEAPVHLMGFGLAVACIDETIQIFTPGRASSLIDVWIDASGFALGLLLIVIFYTISNKIKGD